MMKLLVMKNEKNETVFATTDREDFYKKAYALLEQYTVGDIDVESSKALFSELQEVGYNHIVESI